MTFKFSGNVLFINVESHEKNCEGISAAAGGSRRQNRKFRGLAAAAGGEIENFGLSRRRPAAKSAFFQKTAAVAAPPRRPAAVGGEIRF